MIYVKSKYTGYCYGIYDTRILNYDGWIVISKQEYDEYVKRLGL